MNIYKPDNNTLILLSLPCSSNSCSTCRNSRTYNSRSLSASLDCSRSSNLQQSRKHIMQRETEVERFHHQSAPSEAGQLYKLSFASKASRRTHPITWVIAACCSVLWIIITLAGLVVLIVYLVFRPKTPRFDISGVSLNSAYLDAGTLLNADVTILTNFSNPSHKVDVSFHYLQLNLYFQGTMITTQVIEPFALRGRQSALQNVHLLCSQVILPQEAVKAWIDGSPWNSVAMEIVGSFRTRSSLGRLMHFTYWLNSNCKIKVSAPPTGVLLSKLCTTKH